MAKIQSVKFNFVMNSILTMSAMIFPIITYPYVTGILGPQGIGTVSFANSVVTYFSMFAQLAFPPMASGPAPRCGTTGKSCPG